MCISADQTRLVCDLTCDMIIPLNWFTFLIFKVSLIYDTRHPPCGSDKSRIRYESIRVKFSNSAWITVRSNNTPFAKYLAAINFTRGCEFQIPRRYQVATEGAVSTWYATEVANEISCRLQARALRRRHILHGVPLWELQIPPCLLSDFRNTRRDFKYIRTNHIINPNRLPRGWPPSRRTHRSLYYSLRWLALTRDFFLQILTKT